MPRKFLDFLIELKNRNSLLFKLADWINSILVILLNRRKIEKISNESKQVCLNPAENIRIARLGPNDQNDFYHFLYKGFSEESRSHLKLYNVTGKFVHRLLKSRTNIIFGVYHFDELVGYGVVKIFLRKNSFIVFGVKESWRRKGVGSALVRFMVEANKKNNFKTNAIVDRENIASYKLLSGLGFKTLKETDKHCLMRY
ncbi:MAG: GNAT family N-acetyltransferase [Candidatus Omnitrophica bacterium]|nr:GNAT family N-acetyltransferase [Candidatus Omnitrophota bacterium]